MSAFSINLKRFAEKTNTSLLKARNGICLKLFSGTVMATPVLTGRLRANWQCSLNEPITAPLPVETVDPAGAKTIGAITKVVSGSSLNDTKVVLSNNLPYARRIEFDGWSHTKAPNGMMRITLKRIYSLLDDFVSK